jgi:hypothetical protein
MAHTDRHIYERTHRENWEPQVGGEYYRHRGSVPSWRKKQVRKAERSGYKNAMQRGDYEAAEMQADRNSLRIKNVYVLDL